MTLLLTFGGFSKRALGGKCGRCATPRTPTWKTNRVPRESAKQKKTRLPEMVSKGLTHFALEKSGLQLPTEATSRRVHLTAQPPGRINQLSRNRREVSIGKGPPQQPAKSFVSMPIFPELLGSTSSGDLLGMMLWPSSRI